MAEQREEEKPFKSILDKIKIIGTEGRGLFFVDQEMRLLAAAKAAGPGS